MNTFIPKIDSSNRQWWIIDLNGVTLGRAAVQVADILRGKNKPIFTPHLDTGDHVVAVNSSGITVTGNKLEDHFTYRYSGYPGGLRKKSLGTLLKSEPQEVFLRSVKRMLPKNRLGRKMIKKLHVYPGSEHPHAPQKPENLKLK